MVDAGEGKKPVADLEPGDEIFSRLPAFWQMYCRKAWEKMGVI